MSVQTSAVEPSVVLHDVEPATWRANLAALPALDNSAVLVKGELHLPAVIRGVSWESYEAFLNAIGDRSFRHIYALKTLRITMSALEDHDWVKKSLARLLEMLAYQLDIPAKGVGSTTQRRLRVKRGVEPDEAYYIASEPQVRGGRKRDYLRDPPPDLVIEVDVTSQSFQRMEIYAIMGVPEIWRYDGEQLFFHQLAKDGVYVDLEHSLSFPMVRASDIATFLDLLYDVDDLSVMKKFVTWIRKQKRRRPEG